MYGFYQTFATHEYFSEKGKRPAILSRSTFAGSGKFGGHWLGENLSRNSHMGPSVDSILLFNMFGIPFVGDSVCGFKGDVSITTCARWYKLAIIYPFARNHNDFGTEAQEPFVERFQEHVIDSVTNITAAEVIRKSMLTRYGLHSYMYTQFHKSSKEGNPPLKPLFFNYPAEKYTYSYTSENLLIGDDILATLDTSSGSRQYHYWPGKGTLWCPIWETTVYKCVSGGARNLIKIPIGDIWLYIRAGSAIPLQLSDVNKFDNVTVKNLDDLQNHYTDIGLLLDSSNEASGVMRFDDGESPDLDHYNEITIEAKAELPWVGRNKLNIEFSVTHSNSDDTSNSQKLGEILIYDASTVGFVKRSTGELVDINNNVYTLLVDYNQKRNLARVSYVSEEPIAFKDIKRIHVVQPA